MRFFLTGRFHMVPHQPSRYAQSIRRAKPIFKRAEQSFRETILPSDVNAKHIQDAREELFARFKGNYVGVHIRRGDRLPVSWKWSNDYVPVKEYVDFVAKTWKRLYKGPDALSPAVYIATDSPSTLKDYAELAPESTEMFALSMSDNNVLKNMASPHRYIQTEWNRRRSEERIRWTRGAIVDFALVSGAWLTSTYRAPQAVICTMR